MIIHLLSAHGTYVKALNGGGGGVQADAATAQNWETFVLCDALGNAFEEGETKRACDHGFQVSLRTEKGRYLLPDWGRDVSATAVVPPAPPMIILREAGTGRVREGDVVSFCQQLSLPLPGVSPYWITAEQTGERPLRSNRQMASPGAWERFTVIRQRSAGVTIVPDRSPPGAPVHVRIPDRRNEPRHIDCTVQLSGSAPRGGTRVKVAASSAQASFGELEVLVPQGVASQAARLPLQRTGDLPSNCRERVSGTISAASTSTIAGSALGAGVPVHFVPANAYMAISAGEPLKRQREGVIQVQIKPDAPLAAGEYRVKLTAPPSQAGVDTPELRVRFEPRVASAPAPFIVFPLVAAPAPGVCVTATLTGGEGWTVEQQWPFPVEAS